MIGDNYKCIRTLCIYDCSFIPQEKRIVPKGSVWKVTREGTFSIYKEFTAELPWTSKEPETVVLQLDGDLIKQHFKKI